MPNHLVRCAFAGLLAAGLAAQDDLAARLRVLIEKTKTVSGSSALGLLESALRELPDPPDAETPRSLVDWYWHVSNAAEWAGSKAQGETRKQLLAVAARGWRSYIAFYATQPVEDNENDRQNIQAARRRLIARLDLDGKYPEAIAVQDAVVRLLRVTAGPDGRETLHEEINLALFQNRNHQHADAQRTTRAALERIEKRFAGSPLHARARTQLASTINDRGWYWDDEVLELQRDAVAIYEAILARPPSEDTAQLQRHAASELATTRWELAQTYLNRGDYSKARRLAQRSYDALIADRGKDSEDTSWARGILAHALHSLGDLSESLRLYKTNLRLRIKQRGDDHPFTSLVRTNVGAVLLYLGRNAEARDEYQRAVQGYEKHGFAGNDYRLIRARYGLATALGQLGEHEQAIHICKQNLERLEKNDFPTHDVRLTLAENLRRAGMIDQAVHHFAKAMPVARRREDYRWVTYYIRRQALALASAGDRAALEACLDGLVAMSDERVADCLWLPPRQALELARVVGNNAELVLSMADHVSVESQAKFHVAAFELLESLRGIAIRNSRVDALIARDPEVAAARRRIALIRRERARMVSKLGGKGGETVPTEKAAREMAAEKERNELTILLAQLERVGIPRLRITVADLDNALEKRSAIIAYRVVKQWTIDGKAPKSGYVAFVLRKSRPLRLGRLGPADRIEKLVEDWRVQIDKGMPSRGRKPSQGKDEELLAGIALRKQVLDRLEKALSNTNVLHVCPDGALHRIPLDALPKSRTAWVSSSRKRFRFETSLLRLLAKRDPVAGPASLLAVGGVDYGAKVSRGTTRGRTRAPDLARLRSGAGGYFTELDNTGPEADDVVRYFEASGGNTADKLSGDQVTKEALFRLAPARRFLHFATHGYFLTDLAVAFEREEDLSTLERTIQGYAPFTLCGLALSGANNPPDEDGTAPGVLTAEELAGLDLRSCELVVLSACETYRGVPRQGQGIQSLQTAFHAAGVRTVVSSLWKVNDQATRDFMKLFYEAMWKNGRTKADALDFAKRQFRKKAPTRHWAGWILTGDPK